MPGLLHGLLVAGVLVSSPPPVGTLQISPGRPAQETLQSASPNLSQAPVGSDSTSAAVNRDSSRDADAANPATRPGTELNTARLILSAVVLGLFLLGTIVVGLYFLFAMEKDGLWIESHWGGFGGGGGGVRLSRPLSYLVAMIFFAGLTAALAFTVIGAAASGSPEPRPTGQAPTGSLAPDTASGAAAQGERVP